MNNDNFSACSWGVLRCVIGDEDIEHDGPYDGVRSIRDGWYSKEGAVRLYREWVRAFPPPKYQVSLIARMDVDDDEA